MLPGGVDQHAGHARTAGRSTDAHLGTGAHEREYRVLRDVLHAIETAKPLLWVDNVNLRPIRMPLRPGQKGVADRLSIDFEVIGYMRAG